MIRRLLIALAALAILATSWPIPVASAAENCQFVLGFKALHDAIPDMVGDCKAPEHHNPSNGDGLQETVAWHGKGGLLVWRKADNWTAFTDGANTWINGPQGVQKRANNDRFSWERDGAPSTRASVAAYLFWAGGNSTAMSELLGAMGEQMTLGGSDPAKYLTDPAWRSKTASILARLRAVGVAMQTYPEPLPGDCAEVQSVFSSIGQDMVYVADEITAGLANFDPHRLENASNRLKAMGPKSQQMLDRLNALVAKWTP